MFKLFTSPGADDIKLPDPANTLFTEVGMIVILTLLFIQSFWRTDQLLNAAKVNFLVDRIAAITQATREFKTLYNALPGDFAYASVHIDSALINGNGNGKIDNDIERGQAWAHLSASALLPHFLVDGGPVSNDIDSCPLNRCPNNTRRQGMIITYGQSGLNFTQAGNELLMGNNLPIRTLAGLDAFLDDGSSKTGLVQLNKNIATEKMANCQYTPLRVPEKKQVLCAGVVKLL